MNLKKVGSLLLSACMLLLTTSFSACEDESPDSSVCLHDYAWYEAKAVTCENNGIIEGTCSKCGDKDFEELLAVGHLFEDGVCTKCGKEEDLSSENNSSTEQATPLDAWTFDKLYEKAQEWGFIQTKDEYKEYLKDLVIEDAHLGAFGQLCVTISSTWGGERIVFDDTRRTDGL